MTDLTNAARDVWTLYPASDWHDDDGDVLWHRLDEHGLLCEAPVVGHPLSSDWDEEDMAEYVLWSRIPHVNWPNTEIERLDRAEARRAVDRG